MQRFELTGSGVGDRYAKPALLLRLARFYGATRPRLAYHQGWSNQPVTLRFSAESWSAADTIAQEIRASIFRAYRRKWETSLDPMLRAYPC